MTSTPQPLQACITGQADVIRLAADAEKLAVRCAHVAELRGEDDLVAPAAEGAADQFLIAADTIHVGGVDEIHAEFDGAMDRRDRFRFIASAVEFGHAHAPEPQCRDSQTRTPQITLLHHRDLRSRKVEIRKPSNA